MIFYNYLNKLSVNEDQRNDFNYNPNYSYKNDYYIENFYIHCWIGTYKQSCNKRTQF